MSIEQMISSIAALDLPLQAELDRLKEEFEGKFAPPEATAIMRRVIDELIASGRAERAFKAGDVAPEFALPDADEKLVLSKDLLASGPIVVSFYRGVWCPYCNFDLTSLEAVRAEMESRGAGVVAVSQQTAASNRNSQRANRLGFPVLADDGGRLADPVERTGRPQGGSQASRSGPRGVQRRV